ncbi:MAG: hypothetical protein ACI4MA_09985 [Treponema sp.]
MWRSDCAVVNFDVITDIALSRATRIARGNSLCGVQTVVVVNFDVILNCSFKK